MCEDNHGTTPLVYTRTQTGRAAVSSRIYGSLDSSPLLCHLEVWQLL